MAPEQRLVDRLAEDAARLLRILKRGGATVELDPEQARQIADDLSEAVERIAHLEGPPSLIARPDLDERFSLRGEDPEDVLRKLLQQPPVDAAGRKQKATRRPSP